MPTLAARHAAARTGADPSAATDTIPVVVTNSAGVSTTTSLTVSVSKQNNAPLVTKVYAPASSSDYSSNLPYGLYPSYKGQIVTGYINVSDADGDEIDFRYSYPSYGTLQMWSAGGGQYRFEYKVSQSRQAERYNQNGSDGFRVVFTDGYGDTTYAYVSLTYSVPENRPYCPYVCR